MGGQCRILPHAELIVARSIHMGPPKWKKKTNKKIPYNILEKIKNKRKNILKAKQKTNLESCIDQIMSLEHFHMFLYHCHYFFTRKYTIREVLSFIKMIEENFSLVIVVSLPINIEYCWFIVFSSNFRNSFWRLWNTNISSILK